MAVPKRKSSKARRDKRRSSTWKLDAPQLTRCQKCGEFKLAHHVCKFCGTYNGKAILEPAE
ncbi:MAG: 50S ribosomal protein L32 [Clostridiales bacterium]|nr:50S ribosomal protein L32 [Clostridiales bacterium]